MTKDESFAAGDFSQSQQMRKVSIECNLSQAHDDAQIFQDRNLLIDKSGAVSYLGWAEVYFLVVRSERQK